jgi:hypothetical protein
MAPLSLPKWESATTNYHYRTDLNRITPMQSHQWVEQLGHALRRPRGASALLIEREAKEPTLFSSGKASESDGDKIADFI